MFSKIVQKLKDLGKQKNNYEKVEEKQEVQEIKEREDIEDIQTSEEHTAKQESTIRKRDEDTTKWADIEGTSKDFYKLLPEIEKLLLKNDFSLEVIEDIKEKFKSLFQEDESKKYNFYDEIKNILSSYIREKDILEEIKKSESKPFVILLAGINGSGKTTTISKLGSYLQNNKLSVCFSASDTFRAAAIQQIEIHGKNLNIPVIKKDYGSDPASVGFDAIKYAQKNSIDVVLIDTAGRMQNRDSLMKELEKISRVTKPNMKILVIESTTGNDAITQAKTFNESIGIDGIILSKFDVDKKIGTAFSLSKAIMKPILFLGIGQGYEDLKDFEYKESLNNLFNVC